MAGDVFAVLTNQGNYSKVKVITYGYDLNIQWVTYHWTPYMPSWEPAINNRRT